MNSFDRTQGFITDHCCLQQGFLPPPAEKTSLYLSGLRCSVQTIGLSGAGYLALPATVAPGSQRTLDDISIFHLPDSDIMLVNRPNTPHQLQTDTLKCAATQSSRSDEPVPVCTSPACQAGKYAWAHQASRANIQVAPFAVEGIKAKVKGTPDAELRKSLQKFQATDKSQKSEASYLEPDRRKRVTYSPEMRKLNRAKSQAKYFATTKGKLARSVACAKRRAYLTASKRGFSKEEAKEKSERAAKKRRVQFLKDLLTNTIDKLASLEDNCPLLVKLGSFCDKRAAGSGQRSTTGQGLRQPESVPFDPVAGDRRSSSARARTENHAASCPDGYCSA